MSALDLHAVHELCRLVLVAGRLGCRVRLDGASDELREVLDLAGVGSVVLDPAAPDEASCGRHDIDDRGGDLR